MKPATADATLRTLLLTLAAGFNRHVEPGLTWDRGPAAPGAGGAGGPRPGDDFNARAAWEDILGPAGWEAVLRRGDVTYWRRPGKGGRVWSATVGHCRDEAGLPLLYVFTISAPPFAAERCYSKFAAYALLSHAGDYRAAARALAGQGYGTPRATNGTHASSTAATAAPPVQPPAPPLDLSDPIPASLLRLDDPARLWLWKGYLARGYLTMLSALWKSGKSTLLAHLLKALGGGSADFCGLSLAPSKVLYVTEEPEGLWARRRDALGIADNVEFLVQPFMTKPRWDDWNRFLLHVRGLTAERKYDLVALDTISNLWPVRDENDASQVTSALMPLRAALGGAGGLIVHHARKTDGTEATSARGSGSFPAFVDTIVELRRFNAGNRADRRRVLTAYGRWQETPDELVVELTDDGYRPHGDRRQARNRDLRTTILQLLPNEPPGHTWQEIRGHWPGDECPRTQALLDALHEGVEHGEWHCEGEGQRGDPYRFWVPPPP